MKEEGRFIAVGENIHCTRIYKVGGRFVRTPAGGEPIIAYSEAGEERQLPIPQRFIQAEDWQSGKLKHAAVGIWQGFYGQGAARQAGIDYLQHLARRQEAAGASFLDLNLDEFSTDQEERVKIMGWAVQIIQQASSLPLSIDSSNLEIMRAGLGACDPARGKPLVNSVSLERQELLGEAAEMGAALIAGAGGKSSMPHSKAERIENLETLVQKLTGSGFQLQDIYLDPLVFPVSVDPNNGVMILEAIEALRNTFGRAIHFAPGLSNVSYGMPRRKLLNQVFTYLCREKGLDGGIVDPLQINGELLSRLDPQAETFKLARAVLTGEDQFGMNYISAAREGRL